MAIAIEITGYNPDTGLTEVITLGIGDDGRGFCTRPGDTPEAYWDARLTVPGIYKLVAYHEGATFGASNAAHGAIEALNTDGGLDYLAGWGFDGRPVVKRIGTVGDAYPSAWSTVFSGLIDRFELSRDRAVWYLKDKQQLFSKPLQTSTYGGTNALPAGVDGVAGDLKGKRKPRLYGRGLNMPALCVNTSRQIYQVSDKALSAVNGVYDGGAALTAGATYADQAAMESTPPAAGQYRAWLAGGMIRLGSVPAQQVTVDADAAGTSADWTVAQLLDEVAQDAGIPAADTDNGDIAALDAAASAVVGYWVSGDETAATVMDALANSVGAFYWFDAAGTLRMERLVESSSSPLSSWGLTSWPASPWSGGVTITLDAVIDIERKGNPDTDKGIPAYRVELDYQPIEVTQTSGLVGSVTDARRAYLAQQYRRVTAEDLSVLTVHPNAPVLQFQTRINDAAAAQAEADRRLALYKVRRDLVTATVRLDAEDLAAMEIGQPITVKIDRFGYQSGRRFICLGIEPDLATGRTVLTLWG